MSTSRLSIGHRLSLVLGIILSLFLVSCLYGILQLRSVTREMDDMLNNALATERLAGDWYRNITNGATRTTAISKSSDPALAEFFAKAAAASSKQSSELQKQTEQRLETDEERALFAQISQHRKAYLSTRDEINRLKKPAMPKARRGCSASNSSLPPMPIKRA